MKLCMQERSPATHTVLKSSFIDDSKAVIGRKSILDNKWYDWLNSQSRTSLLLTNRVRNKETNQQIHSRNIRSGRDLDPKLKDERPILWSLKDPSHHDVLVNVLWAFQSFYFLTHSQTTNFRLFQTERACRRQFQIWWKWQNVLWNR